MSGLKIGITGIQEINEVLDGMPRQITDKVLQSAHYSAGRPTVAKAKLLAPEGPTGHLVDSIGIVKDRSRGKRELGLVFIGPRRGRYKGHAGHLVEFGTVARTTDYGANRGVMPARPFMEPAWEQTKTQVLGDIEFQIGKKLYGFMKKTLRK